METISLEPKQISLNVGIEVAPPIADDVQGANDDNSELRDKRAGRRPDEPGAHGTRADPGDNAQGGDYREVWSGQCGATIRSGNNWWRDVCFTLSTATGDNVPCVMEIYE